MNSRIVIALLPLATRNFARGGMSYGCVVGAILVSFAGCHGAGAKPLFAVYDSAGVRVAVSQGPKIPNPLRVDAASVLRIGVLEGDAPYEFSHVTDVGESWDGQRFLVADAGNSALRAFDAHGALVWAVGSRGDGPGEFRAIDAFVSDSAGTWVFDAASDRLTRISTGGRVGDVLPLPSELGRGSAHLVGAFRDGSLAIRSTAMIPARRGFERQSVAISRFAPGRGAYESAILVMPGQTWLAGIDGGQYRLTPIPFLARPSFAVGNTEVYSYPGSGRRIFVHDTVGKLRQVLEIHRPTEDSSELDFDRYWQRQGGAIDHAQRKQLETLRRDSFPDGLPLAMRLIVDPSQCLWVGEYSPDGVIAAWDVISPNGRWLARVETPTGYSLYEIGTHRLVGVRRDDLDVEYIEVYPVPTQLDWDSDGPCAAEVPHHGS